MLSITSLESVFRRVTKKHYLVSERKPRSGTILDFGLRILDSKKKEFSVSLKFSSKTGKPYFKVFGRALLRLNAMIITVFINICKKRRNYEN